jgi:hypothetical protein
VNGGIFTKAFVDGLEGAADYAHTGIITVDDLSVYVTQRVAEEALRHQYNQTPLLRWLPAYGDGKFIFYK